MNEIQTPTTQQQIIPRTTRLAFSYTLLSLHTCTGHPITGTCSHNRVGRRGQKAEPLGQPAACRRVRSQMFQQLPWYWIHEEQGVYSTTKISLSYHSPLSCRSGSPSGLVLSQRRGLIIKPGSFAAVPSRAMCVALRPVTSRPPCAWLGE